MAPDEHEEHDPSRETFDRLAVPLIVPALVFLFAVLVIYGLSRIYLELNTYKIGDVTMATPLAIGVSLFILIACTMLASSGRVSRMQIASIFLVAAVLLTAGGIWAGVHDEGETEAHVSETPDGGGTPVPPGGISVTLIDPDWSVTVEPESAPAGPATFVVTNDSDSLQHNLRIAKTDLAPDALPYDDDTLTVDESQLDVVAETENIEAGTTAQLQATLEAGSYVLFCNVAAHWESGMHTAFTVE